MQFRYFKFNTYTLIAIVAVTSLLIMAHGAKATDLQPYISSIVPIKINDSVKYNYQPFNGNYAVTDPSGKIYPGSRIRISGGHFYYDYLTNDLVKAYLNGSQITIKDPNYFVAEAFIDLTLPMSVLIGQDCITVSAADDKRTISKEYCFDVLATPLPAPAPAPAPTPTPTPTPSPTPTPTPPLTCTVDIWSCDNWNACSLSGVQSRNCKKTFDCPNVQTAPPVTDQYCEAPNKPAQQVPQDSSVSNQDTIIKATVKLMCPLDEKWWSQGSGTVIDSSGTILTNQHVIKGTPGCLVGFINNFNDEPYFGDRQIADIVKVSSNEDMAILKLRNPQHRQLQFIDIIKANNNSLQLGDKVNIYGYPAIFGTTITSTSGGFSGREGSYLKTTAILEHGSSGGGAYLNTGMFMGIPSAVVKGELNALGYILSINTINAWLGNSSVAYNNNSNNNYSRVSSVLENVDLNKLDSLQLVVPGKNPTDTGTHQVGINVKSPDGTISMIAPDGTQRPYTSAGAFLSYGFNSFSNVVDASSADLALTKGSFIPPRDGKIICSDRGTDKGTCYLITNGKKSGFTSATIFTGLGFSFNKTSKGDVSWMSSVESISETQNAHRSGVLINNQGTYYLITDGGLLGIPDAPTLQSWGYAFSDAVSANVADKSLTRVGTIQTRQSGQLTPQ